MLKYRLISGTVMGLAVIGTAVFAPAWLLCAVITAVALAALGEYYGLLDAAQIPNYRIVGMIAGLGWLLAQWGSLQWPLDSALRRDADMLALTAVFSLLFLRQFFFRQNAHPLGTLAGSWLGLVYACVPFLFFVRLILLGGGADGRWLLLFMIVVVKCTDVGAFFIGSKFGRHKLIPRISPAKSWEGTLGGILVAVGVSLFLQHGTLGYFGADLPLMTKTDAVVLGFALAVAGVLGDLAESLLKRAAGVKDSSHAIAGMGGLLDVVDSLLPAAPVMYFYVRYVMMP